MEHVCELLVVVPVLVQMDSVEQTVKPMPVSQIHVRTVVHACEQLVVEPVLVQMDSAEQIVESVQYTESAPHHQQLLIINQFKIQ